MSYAWDFAEFGTCGGPDTAITFPNDTGRFYPMQLILTNELGCADTIRRSAPVEDQFLICVPNALSPDGDGRKETYFVEGKDHNADGFELIVFDRSGSEIYAATDPARDGRAPITVVRTNPVPVAFIAGSSRPDRPGYRIKESCAAM